MCFSDANKERVLTANALPFIIAKLKSEPWLTLSVLHNVIVDYGRNPVIQVSRTYSSSRLCSAR